MFLDRDDICSQTHTRNLHSAVESAEIVNQPITRAGILGFPRGKTRENRANVNTGFFGLGNVFFNPFHHLFTTNLQMEL